MFLSVEKELIARHYCEMKNFDNSTIYQNLSDARVQVALEFNKEENRWSFSFPLKDCDFNYITYWRDPNKIRLYASERIRAL